MIFGAHVTLYSTDAAADRAFLAEVLGLPAVDDTSDRRRAHSDAVFHVRRSGGRDGGVGGQGRPCSAVETARWGSLTRLKLPGGGEVGVYQPTHPLALSRA